MLWRLLLFYEGMCIAGTLTYFMVIIVKEFIYWKKYHNVRMNRLVNYLDEDCMNLTKKDWIDITIIMVSAGWLYGMLALNKYYDLCEYDAELRGEKA